MQNIQKIKEKYIADADAIGQKSRFGFFSIPPSHTAAVTYFKQAKVEKDDSGKVKTLPRNIFSGTTSTGSLRKNYFSYVPSAFHGSQYQDPGKIEKQQNLKINKKWSSKQIFRPAKLNKTIARATYEYISQKDQKDKKKYRRQDGRVITDNWNVKTNPQSKIDYQKIKLFKHSASCSDFKLTPQSQKEQKKYDPFKVGHPKNNVFANNIQTFFDTNIKPKKQQKLMNVQVSHDAPFKTSCISPNKPFNKLIYQEEGEKVIDKIIEKPQKKQNGQEPFRLTKIEYNSKPSPSISCSKINLLKSCR